MSRFRNFLWKALAAMADAEYAYPYPYMAVERPRATTPRPRDDASVRASFRAIVEAEWGAGAWSREAPEH